jgi:hypothetical protein
VPRVEARTRTLDAPARGADGVPLGVPAYEMAGLVTEIGVLAGDDDW